MRSSASPSPALLATSSLGLTGSFLFCRCFSRLSHATRSSRSWSRWGWCRRSRRRSSTPSGFLPFGTQLEPSFLQHSGYGSTGADEPFELGLLRSRGEILLSFSYPSQTKSKLTRLVHFSFSPPLTPTEDTLLQDPTPTTPTTLPWEDVDRLFFSPLLLHLSFKPSLGRTSRFSQTSRTCSLSPPFLPFSHPYLQTPPIFTSSSSSFSLCFISTAHNKDSFLDTTLSFSLLLLRIFPSFHRSFAP